MATVTTVPQDMVAETDNNTGRVTVPAVTVDTADNNTVPTVAGIVHW